MVECEIIEYNDSHDLSKIIAKYYNDYNVIDIKFSVYFTHGLGTYYVVMIIYKI